MTDCLAVLGLSVAEKCLKDVVEFLMGVGRGLYELRIEMSGGIDAFVTMQNYVAGACMVQTRLIGPFGAHRIVVTAS